VERYPLERPVPDDSVDARLSRNESAADLWMPGRARGGREEDAEEGFIHVLFNAPHDRNVNPCGARSCRKIGLVLPDGRLAQSPRRRLRSTDAASIYNHMVAHNPLSDAELDRVFHALADATRRDIVARVLAGEQASISALAARYAMSFAAVQKHVAVL
jgi:hypothetical protein